MPWNAAAFGEPGVSQVRVSRHSSAARPYCPQVCSCSTASSVAATASSVLSGGVVVVAGLQQLVDVVLAALRDGVDAPVPERRGPLVGLPGGVGMELGDGSGCPAVHEMQRGLVLAGHRREQAGGPGRGHRGGQAIRRFDGRPPLLSQVSLVAGVLLCGQPGVLQRDLAAVRAFDRLFDGLLDTADTGLALGVGRPLGGLTDLEDQGGVIDRDPVDRRPDHQLGGHRRGRQPLQQPGQHDVVDRQRHGLGQAGVQVPARPGQPGRGVADAAGPQPVLHPLGDVIESGLPAAQQGIEVFQGAGVAADVAVGPVPVGGGQGIQAGQAPHQLAWSRPPTTGPGEEQPAAARPPRAARTGTGR